MTERERFLVERLRDIAATENGAQAIISHLGEWFPSMVDSYDHAPVSVEDGAKVAALGDLANELRKGLS